MGHLRGLGHLRPLAGPVFGQMGGAAQGLLPIRGHDTLPHRAALIGIAMAAGEFGDQAGMAFLDLAGLERGGFVVNLDFLAVGMHGDDPQPQPFAQPQIGLERAPAGLARPARHRHIDLIGHRLPRRGLMQQSQGKARFQFDDHGGITIAQGHDIGRADLGFHLIAQGFEKRLHGRVEVGFSLLGLFSQCRAFGIGTQLLEVGSQADTLAGVACSANLRQNHRRIKVLRSILLFSFLLFAGPVFALCDAPSEFWTLPQEEQQTLRDRANQVPYPEGILWQVEKDGVVSYVIGTMHFYNPRHAKTMEQIAPLLDQTEQVFLETTTAQDEDMKRRITTEPEIAFITEGPSLIDLLGEEAWQQLKPKLRPYGIPGFMAAKYQPWLIGLTVSVPVCAMDDLKQKKTGLDRLVESAAQEQSLPVQSLDDTDNLFALLAGDPLEKQVSDLKWSLKFNLTDAASGSSGIVDHYFREEIQLAWEFSLAQAIAAYGTQPENRTRIIDLMDRVMDELMIGRNLRWMETLLPELTQKPTLIAVGALHLPGENGLLALLERQGFTITRLPLSAG